MDEPITNNYSIWICAKNPELKQKLHLALTRQGIPAAMRDLTEDLLELAGTKTPIIVIIDKAALRENLLLQSCREHCAPILLVLMVETGELTGKELSGIIDDGIDDFILTSIEETVLRAKMQAYLRRLAPPGPPPRPADSIKSTTGKFKVDMASYCLLVKQNGGYQKIDNFTPTEFKIVSILIRNSALVVERKSILDHIWGGKAGEVNFENIDKHVESIRKKLGPHGKKIKTVYGQGYMFAE